MKINRTVSRFVIVFCALAALVFVGLRCYDVAYTAYANEPFGEDKENVIELVVESGDNYYDVAKQLKENELIDSTVPFFLRSMFSEYRAKLQPGTYEVNETMGIDDVLAVVSQMESN